MALQTDIAGGVAVDRHAIGYVRVSTKNQNEGTQVEQLLAQGVPRDQIFVDTAVSGAIPAPDRLGFGVLLEYVPLPRDHHSLRL